MVIYRKYRPQKIDDLDSEEIRNGLQMVLQRGVLTKGKQQDIKNPSYFPHAFLFTGPKGLGKTSTARIVAKVINCTGRSSKTDIEPCGKCEQCISITNGTNMDVLEIDGASNRGIDEIRDLRDKVRLAPFKASMKVYIIDEVHMLTTEAFNALLKTLEEPPAHVVFILCTTEPHKVPATIVSRCVLLRFKIATEDELVRSFERIVKGEKISVDKEALYAVAKLSDGSFRDGAKILEELSLLANGKKITKEFVEKKYNLTNIDKELADFLIFLKEKDSQKAFKLIAGLVEDGTDLKYFLEQIINNLHLLLLKKAGIEEINSKSPDFELDEIKVLVDLFSKAYLDTKYAVLPQLPLELAVVEWSSKTVSNQQPHIVNDASSGNNDIQSQPRSISESLSKNLNNKPSIQATAFNSLQSGLSHDSKDMDKLFEELIEKVKPHNHSVAGVLRGCVIKSYDGQKLAIEARYKFHKEKLEENRTMQILENIMAEISGKKVIISVVLKS